MAKKRTKRKQRPEKKPEKIRKYRKPINLNIGMLIFGAVLIYVVYCVMNYLQSDPPKPYEVQKGSLTTNSTYRGIVLRDEVVVTAQTAGFLNYYAREGERVAIGDVVYTVDETGRFKEYQESLSQGENTLDLQELLEFRSEIVSFMHDFDPRDFSSAYDFKYELSGTILRLANDNMLKDLAAANEFDDGTFQTCRAQETGIVAYWTDGYEELAPEQVTEEILKGEDYHKTQLTGNEIPIVGDPIYKLALHEDWSIVIPVEAEEGLRLQEEGYVKVRFLKNQYESWASVNLLTGADGKQYVQLGFNNSMLTFISDRFLEVEIMLDEKTGLKIPNSSIAYRDFFLVPDTYLTQGGNRGRDGVLRQIFLEDGTPSSEFVETDIYSHDEETGEYFLDTAILAVGDVLIKPDGLETYTVSKRETLIGVYNMNKGYADFREINILDQNEEYAIVESNTQYGLNVYDNIVLDASSVTDEQFLYQ